jgi:probable addiction module antidote protein
MEDAGDDPAFIVQALGTMARAKGMPSLAKKTGLTREGLYKALSKGGNPSFGTVFRVIHAKGLRMELAR